MVHEDELAAVTEGGCAFVSDAIADKSFEDDLQSGGNVEVGWRGPMQHGGGEIFFDRVVWFVEVGVVAAEAGGGL
jgi:hypothetical protein